MTSKLGLAYKIYSEQGIMKLLRESFWFVHGTLLRSILATLIAFISPILRKMGESIPTKSTQVLFATRPGRLYEDNSRYLYEYILESEPELNPVWITHEKRVYRELLDQSLPVRYVYSLGGLWALWRASVGVTTHGKYSFSFSSGAVPSSLSIVVVGHGDPVKSVPRTPTEIEEAKKRLEEIDYQVTTSDFTRAFRLEQYVHSDEEVESLPNSLIDTFITPGYPRCDLLLAPREETKKNWEEFLNGHEPNQVLLYAPTKHYGINVNNGDPAVDFFPFEDFDRKELYDLLEAEKLLVLFRPHPSNVRAMQNAAIGPYKVLREELTAMCEECEYIRMATQYEIADTTQLLPFVDILVTDYSSIYHDFLLFDKPILFIPYDYEAFESARGFTYEYYEHLPGPEITSFTEFKLELLNILNDKDEYQDARQELRDHIHKHQEGGARERLSEHILELCGEKSQIS